MEFIGIMFKIKVQIKDAFKEDLGKGIARCDPALLLDYNLNSGDIINIISPSSKKNTAAYVFPSDLRDKDTRIIRLDAQLRRNLSSLIDDIVIIYKSRIDSAQQVSFAGYQKRISLLNPNLLKERLKNWLITKGDIITFVSGSEKLELIVINHTPQLEVVRIDRNTTLFCQEQSYNGGHSYEHT